MKINQARISAISILTLLLTSVFAFPSTVATATRIYLDPSNNIYTTSIAYVGFKFNVTVWVENSPDIGAWEVYMEFNDSILRVTRWFEPKNDPQYIFYGKTTSPNPTPPDPGYVHLAPGKGRVQIAVNLFPTPPAQPPSSGTGKLCILEFNITAVPTEPGTNQSSILHLNTPDTYLLDPDGNEVPNVIKEDGSYQITRLPSLIHNINTSLNYSTIQAAISASETLDGHTLVCDDGNYSENVDVYKSVKIMGAGPSLCTVIPPEMDDGFDVTADNVTVQGFTIESVAGYAGVFLDKATHCDISDNVLTGGGSGIVLKGSSDNTISGNSIYSLPGNGIDIRDVSQRNRILSNNLNRNHYGIFVCNASNYNVVSDNFVNSSDWAGIRLNWLESNFAPVSFNNITDNSVCNNYEGIMLDYPSDDNFAYDNMVSDNYMGIRLRRSSSNTMTHNTVISNVYGVYLEDCPEPGRVPDLVYDNFFNNTNNAWDNGYDSWNTIKHAKTNIIGDPYIGGNYWSDNPNPADADGDGIGDTAYNIAGGTNIDHLPLVTEQPIFIASFMTPEREPYPFDDFTISNGTWRRDFTNVTHIVTGVPNNATYTYVQGWGGHQLMNQFRLNFSYGECREFEFYSTNPAQSTERTRPYLLFQEVGANASLSWNWDPATNNLTVSVVSEPNKPVDVGVFVDTNDREPPNYVLAKTDRGTDKNRWSWAVCLVIWVDRTFMSSGTMSLSFSEVGPDKGRIGFRKALFNGDIVDPFTTGFNSTLWDVDGTLYNMEYVYPQYAVRPGSYILQPQDLPEEYAELKLPVNVGVSKPVILDLYPPKVADLEPFTFFAAAEYFFAHSSYSNLMRNEESKTIAVNVGTKTDYDWWGCFVLPKDRMVKALVAYACNTSYQMSKFYNYTENPVGNYNIVTVRIPSEIDGLNLTYTVLGDINGDGKVDVKDVYAVAKAYGTSLGGPNPPGRTYVPECDINCDGKIDVKDYYIVCKHYGETDP